MRGSMHGRGCSNMDLYTSLTRLKQEMNGGTLPPMTPLPEKALALIDPAFTPGLGALEEHPEKGLRCPVRECGEYRHRLSLHLNRCHKSIGGEAGIKAALSIPRTAKLVSQSHSKKLAHKITPAVREKMREQGREAAASGRLQTAAVRRDRGVASRRDKQTMNIRNLRDKCEAQLSHKLIDLEHSLGRSPSEREAASVYGDGFTLYLRRVYGSWNAALARFGLEARRNSPRGLLRSGGRPLAPDVLRNAVLESLRAYYNAHGSLPTANTINNPARTPLTPAVATIQKAMGADTFPEAMRRAASLLNIRGGRYGLPEKAVA